MTLKNKISRILLISAFTLLLSSVSIAQDYAMSAEDVKPAMISTMIPDVSVKDIDGKEIELRELVKNKSTIFVFYRGGWCPYCNQHLADLKKIEGEIEEMGYQVFAVSADRPEKLKETVSKNELSYSLLSDSPMKATKAFGLAFKVDDKTIARYKEYGIDLEADSGYDHHLLPAPAVYLVNTKGMIKFNYVNPNYRERIDGGILLAAAKAFSE